MTMHDAFTVVVWLGMVAGLLWAVDDFESITETFGLKKKKSKKRRA